MSVKQEPTKAPSQRAMAEVKHKNNIDENKLQTFLEQLERERALAIFLIDHERLDWKDFLKKLKECGSSYLPEAKHWLEGDMGQKPPPPPTPSDHEERLSQKGPYKVEQYKPWDEDFDKGVFKTGEKDNTSKAKIHLDIYSKRNAYADLKWVKPYFEEEGYNLQPKSRKDSLASDASIQLDDRRISESNIGDRDLMTTTPGGGFSSRQSMIRSRLLSEFSRGGSRFSNESPDGLRPRTERYGSPTRRGSLPKDPKLSFGASQAKTGARQGRDFMKDLLVRNAHHRYTDGKKKKVPLKDRMNDFFGKVGELAKQEDKIEKEELKRRWLVLTQGVKAALDQPSDEEDDGDNLHTL